MKSSIEEIIIQTFINNYTTTRNNYYTYEHMFHQPPTTLTPQAKYNSMLGKIKL